LKKLKKKIKMPKYTDLKHFLTQITVKDTTQKREKLKREHDRRHEEHIKHWEESDHGRKENHHHKNNDDDDWVYL